MVFATFILHVVRDNHSRARGVVKSRRSRSEIAKFWQIQTSIWAVASTYLSASERSRINKTRTNRPSRSSKRIGNYTRNSFNSRSSPEQDQSTVIQTEDGQIIVFNFILTYSVSIFSNHHQSVPFTKSDFRSEFERFFGLAYVPCFVKKSQ